MDHIFLSWSSLGFTTLLLALYYVVFSLRGKKSKAGRRLPPGPRGWPIVGSLSALGPKPYETLRELSRKYGPLMSLSLGMKTAVVVSSPAMAKEFLKTHDHIFAGRTVLASVKALSHHKSSIIFGEFGPHWRKLRRIATTELFSHSRLQALQHLRRDQMSRTIRLVFDSRGNTLSLGHTAFCTTLNTIGMLIFSRSVFDPRNPASADFKDIIFKLSNDSGKLNLADFFPFLEFLDPQGLRRQLSEYLQRVYGFFDVLIQNRLDTTEAEPRQAEKDFLDVLLGFRGEDFTLVDVRVLITELFVAACDTITAAVEWAMAELLRNPEKMKRARQELDDVVGDSRRVEESDIQHLPYLHAVVKEVFRLHTTGPLMFPHKAESAVEVAGYLIPKGTQVMVNTWAIGRDPAIWKDPSDFVPERFVEGGYREMEYKGQDMELLPFSAGRRMCPGLPLAITMVHVLVASFVHSFMWAPPPGQRWEDMDMTDEFGLTLKKAVDLKAIPTPRLPHHLY